VRLGHGALAKNPTRENSMYEMFIEREGESVSLGSFETLVHMENKIAAMEEDGGCEGHDFWAINLGNGTKWSYTDHWEKGVANI
jgi:hypothetical protein